MSARQDRHSLPRTHGLEANHADLRLLVLGNLPGWQCVESRLRGGGRSLIQKVPFRFDVTPEEHGAVDCGEAPVVLDRGKSLEKSIQMPLPGACGVGLRRKDGVQEETPHLSIALPPRRPLGRGTPGRKPVWGRAPAPWTVGSQR